MARNWYAEAVEIVGGPDRNWKKLLVEIAKTNPAAVVRARDAILNSGWDKEARLLLKEGTKIAAIKHCREITGWGLKEAKEAVERL